MHTEYRCELNVNFQGNCMATANCPAKGLSLQACKTLCDNTSGCKVILHNKYNRGSCYLKQEKKLAHSEGLAAMGPDLVVPNHLS